MNHQRNNVSLGLFNTCNKGAYPDLKKVAIKMRKSPTNAESIAWSRLKGKRLGFKFRRQHIIDIYIVDFFCLKKALAIEIDGNIHDTQKDQDDARSRALHSLGCRILRFTNRQIERDIDSVMQKISDELTV